MKSEKIKITFIIPSLAAGGAERILSFVASHLSRQKFDCTLLVIGFEKDTVYDVKNTQVIYLNKARVSKSVFSLIHYFRKTKPHVAMSSIVHLNTLTALLSVFFPKIKFVSREANVLSVLNEHSPYKTLFLPKFLVVLGYKLVDCIICQSQDMQQDMTSNYGVPIKKTVLINNPITNVLPPKTTSRDHNKPFRFITVGRLSKEKGHDRIIDVLSKLPFPFHYTMIGDGSEKEAILTQIEASKIEQHVTHIPYTNEVPKYLTESDMFLQGSYSEGFPNALIESCVVGTPILAFNAPGGLNEIIESHINGIIVDTTDHFIENLISLNNSFIFNPKKVNQVVTNKFNKEKIIKQYEALFSNLAS